MLYSGLNNVKAADESKPWCIKPFWFFQLKSIVAIAKCSHHKVITLFAITHNEIIESITAKKQSLPLL